MNIIAQNVQKFQAPVDFFSLNPGIPRVTCFLLKVASRCNLDCDYCYVFHHADQSWKKLPPLFSPENTTLLAERLAQYVNETKLQKILIIFHGGEPLLLGMNRLQHIVSSIRAAIAWDVEVDFSLQTNGVLLDRKKLKILEREKVGVSLSLDGPQEANDLHRLTHKGKSSFQKTLEAFHLLMEFPGTFTGVLSVVDVRIPPREILEFFGQLAPPSLDFLLPDANYLVRPPFRDKKPTLYIEWLQNAFDLWFDHFPHLKIRYFDELLGALSGLESHTDGFGLGDVSLMSIETDGSYHDLDVLKITEENYSSLGMNLSNHSILEALKSPKIALHRSRLTYEGLCQTCQECTFVKVCGGGAVAHRFGKNSFDNPSIYCRELYSLIAHAQSRLLTTLAITPPLEKEHITKLQKDREINVAAYEQTTPENKELITVYTHWQKTLRNRFSDLLNKLEPHYPEKRELASFFKKLPLSALNWCVTRPATSFWMEVMENSEKNIKSYNIAGEVILPELDYLERLKAQFLVSDLVSSPQIHAEEPWLRNLFGKSIYFEEEKQSGNARLLIEQAMAIIKNFSPALLQEIHKLSPVIQFIRDPSAHPDKVVSFSDDTIPGALYVSVYTNERMVDPYDLAESIIHEHRHQKLFLLEHYTPIILSDTPHIFSPWRLENRPVSGVFHGVFVFHMLQKYWRHVQLTSSGKTKMKASQQLSFIKETLSQGISSLKQASLSTHGLTLLRLFHDENKIFQGDAA